MNQFENRAVKEINLKDLFRVVFKRLWLVIIITIFTTAAGWYYSDRHKVEPLYQASSNIIIDADSNYKNTLQVIIKDVTVLKKVADKLGIEKSPESLANQVEVESIDESQVVNIMVTDTDPDRAAEIANTTATVFKGQIPKVIEYKNVSVLSEAQPNPEPINENNPKKLIIGAFVAGIVLGLGLIFLIDSLDDSIRSSRDVEALLGIQVLGSISKMNKRNVNKKKEKGEKVELRGETIGIK